MEGVDRLKGRVEGHCDGAVTTGEEEVGGWGGVIESYLVRLEGLLVRRAGFRGRRCGNRNEIIVLDRNH